MRFLRGRARYFARMLPTGAKQASFVEDRARAVPPATREALTRGLAGAMEVNYISETRRG